MVFVLLIVATTGFRSVSVATHEFGTQQACTEAGKAVSELNGNATVGWTCRPKG